MQRAPTRVAFVWAWVKLLLAIAAVIGYGVMSVVYDDNILVMVALGVPLLVVGGLYIWAVLIGFMIDSIQGLDARRRKG